MNNSILLYFVVGICAVGFIVPQIFPSLMGLNKVHDKDAMQKKPWRT